MICELERVNNRDDVEDLVVLSTDIEAMYPSLDTDVAREFLDCELEVNYDETELALYLAIEMEREELVSLGLGEVTHTRPHKPGQKPRGRKPGITSDEILKRGPKTTSKWVPPERKPTKSESRLMFSLVLEHAIKIAMQNHIYSYNGQLYRQK